MYVWGERERERQKEQNEVSKRGRREKSTREEEESGKRPPSQGLAQGTALEKRRKKLLFSLGRNS